MHSSRNTKKYSLLTTGILFILTIGVLIFTAPGDPTQLVSHSSPDQDASEVLSDDPVEDSSSYLDRSAAYNQQQFQSKSEEIIARYATKYDQTVDVCEAETDADAEPMMTASIARAMAGESRDTTKTAAAMETVTSNMYVNANQLNLRSGVGTDFDKLTTLKRGDKVGVFQKEGEWAKVQTESGLIGYTVAQYLVNSEAEVEPEKPIAYWYINANTLNVRSGPGTGYGKVETLKRGAKIGYFATEGDWARVQTPSGKTGYMLQKYLVESESAIDRASSIPAAGSSTVTSLAQQIADYSKTLQGVKYVYGGSTTSGMDCSGFVQYVYKHFGIQVPRSSANYANFGKRVSRENLRASDILLFDTDGGNWDVSHVGIYLGGDKFIHASTTKGRVIIMSFSQYPAPFYGARRVID